MKTRSTATRRLGVRLAVPLVALAAALAGCTTEAEHLTGVYEAGSGDYISGDGRLITLSADNRDDAVVFAGTLDTGDTISSADLAGQVVLVNFWYASCPPCREEAPDLEALHQQYADAEVTVLGVNVSDSAATAQAFATKWGVSYPSIVDVEDNAVQLAFAGGAYAPNSVPTTLILDREGRVAARYSGLIDGTTTLSEIIDDLLAETA